MNWLFAFSLARVVGSLLIVYAASSNQWPTVFVVMWASLAAMSGVSVGIDLRNMELAQEKVAER